MNDGDLFTTVREQLFTAVLGDVMDTMGLHHQFLPPTIRSLVPDHVLVGRAMPVLEADCCGDVLGHSGQSQPFGLMLDALDGLRAGEVYITTGASHDYALWGGLMSTRAKALGAAGAVLDGFHRDTREILGLDFPVFSTGAYAQDQKVRGRVIDYRCPIAFRNGARVEPGDLVVGDMDGVVILPQARLGEIIEAAVAKVEGEADVRRMIGEGKGAAAIFTETGIM